MKVKLIKEDRNLYKASLRNPIIYGAIEGIKRNEAKFALVDNKGREIKSPIIISGKQLKEMVSTIPQEEFDALIEEGVLKIIDNRIVVKSIETIEKEALLKLGVKKEIVETFRPTAITRLLKDIKSGMLFVTKGELVSKANKASAERHDIVQAAVAAGITDPKVMSLSNEQLIAKTEIAIEENKAKAKEVEQTLSKLKLLLDEPKFKEIETEKLEVLKVVLVKAEKHYDTKFKEFKEIIKGFETEKELLDFVGLDKDIAKLELAKEQYSDKKDAIERKETEDAAKAKEKELKDKAKAKEKELKDKAKADAKVAKDNADKETKKVAEKAKEEELKTEPEVLVLTKPEEIKK